MSGFGLFLGNYVRRAFMYRWLVLVPMVLVFALVTMYVTLQPDTYESHAILMPPIANPADGATRAEVKAIARTMFRSAADRLLSTRMLERVVDKVDPYPTRRQAKGVESVVELLRGKIRVDINRGTGTITVTCSHSVGENPAEMATTIVNTLTGLFVSSQRDALEDQVMKHKAFLDLEKSRSRKELEKAQQALDGFKSANKNALPDDVGTNNAQIERMTRDIQDYKRQQRTYEHRIRSLNREWARLDMQLNAVGLQDQNTIKYALEAGERLVAELEVTLKELLDIYSPGSDKVVYLKNHMKYLREMNQDLARGSTREGTKRREDYVRYVMDETRKDIDISAKEISELDKRVVGTGKTIKEARARVFTAARIEGPYLSLQRTVAEAETRYNSVFTRHAVADQRARLDQHATVSPIEVEQSAYVPAQPASPDRLVTSLMGLVLGLGLGLGLAIARHKLDRAYHRPDDLRALLPGAVLVTVPEVHQKGTRLGVMFASVLGGLVLAGIFTATVAILGVQVGWWGEPEMVRALINLR